jgi:hypothetical protein
VWPVSLSTSCTDRGRLVVFGKQNPDIGIARETAVFMGVSLRESGGRVLLIEVCVQNAEAGKYFLCYRPNISQFKSSENTPESDLMEELVIRKETINLDLVLGFPIDYEDNGLELAAIYKRVVEEALDTYDVVIVDAIRAGSEVGDLNRWLHLKADVNLTSEHVPSPGAEVKLPASREKSRDLLREALAIEAWPSGEGTWPVGQGERVALLVPTPEWIPSYQSGRGEIFVLRGLDQLLLSMEPLGKLIVEPNSSIQV